MTIVYYKAGKEYYLNSKVCSRPTEFKICCVHCVQTDVGLFQ